MIGKTKFQNIYEGLCVKNLIQKFRLEIFLEKKNATCHLFKSMPSFNKLKELHNLLKLSKDHFEIKIYKFKKYSITDYIDDEKLCENYLSYCIQFEEALTPAILITLEYGNGKREWIKITGKDFKANIHNFIELILEKIIDVISEFFN